MKPVRIQLSRKKGWRMPTNTVKVDRASRWGNPFKVGGNPSQFSIALPDHCDTVEVAVKCYAYYAGLKCMLSNNFWVKPLKGKNLACWCKPDAPCHADVLLELANK